MKLPQDVSQAEFAKTDKCQCTSFWPAVTYAISVLNLLSLMYTYVQIIIIFLLTENLNKILYPSVQVLPYLFSFQMGFSLSRMTTNN